MSNLLSLITFIPLVAAIILALVARSDSESALRNVKILSNVGNGFYICCVLICIIRF